METIVLEEELKTAMRLLGARSIEELSPQYVSIYQPISEAIVLEHRIAKIRHLLAKYPSIEAPDLRRPVQTRATAPVDVGEALTVNIPRSGFGPLGGSFLTWITASSAWELYEISSFLGGT